MEGTDLPRSHRLRTQAQYFRRQNGRIGHGGGRVGLRFASCQRRRRSTRSRGRGRRNRRRRCGGRGLCGGVRRLRRTSATMTSTPKTAAQFLAGLIVDFGLRPTFTQRRPLQGAFFVFPVGSDLAESRRCISSHEDSKEAQIN